MTTRSRRAELRRGKVTVDSGVLVTVRAAIELAFAFYDADVVKGRLTDYVARCVAEDLTTRYRLSPIEEVET